jgi:uncharacterized membrane protein
MEDQDRKPDAEESAPGGGTGAIEKAPEAPPLDFKAVLRDVQRTVADEVKAGLTQAAAETVAPAARQAASSAMVYATTKAPGMLGKAVKTTVVPKLQEAGGAKAVVGVAAKAMSNVPGLVSKVPGALPKLPKLPAGGLGSMLGRLGGRAGEEGELKGTGRGRRLPMQAAIDVSVPVEVAYNQWTQFEEFPKFMHRVERIEQKDDTHVIWHEKIWGVRRQWEAEIVEQRPNERIMWKSTSGPQNIGVVNFHRHHDPRLTRVQVNLDFDPTGLIEKTGRGWRAAIRALDTDLQRFKAFVEMRESATGAWRGRIKDAEVQPEEGEQQPEEQQAQAPEAGQADQQPEAQETQEQQPEAEAQQAEEEEEPQAGPQEAEEEEEEPQAEAQATGEQQPQAETGEAEAGEAEPPPADEGDEDEEGEPVVPERGRRTR